jgi:hypothetical protein
MVWHGVFTHVGHNWFTPLVLEALERGEARGEGEDGRGPVRTAKKAAKKAKKTSSFPRRLGPPSWAKK